MPGMNNTKTAEADRDSWRTPPEVFELAKRLIASPFLLDAAADGDNSLCESFMQIADDGAAHDTEWLDGGWTFCNPPYSSGNLPRWTLKAVHEAIAGRQSVLLLPFQGEAWFAHNVVGRAEIVLLEPRVAFLRPDGTVGESPRSSSFLAIYRAGAKFEGPMRVERWK